MSDTKSASQHAVDEFFRALSDRDVSIASAVFTEETVESLGCQLLFRIQAATTISN